MWSRAKALGKTAGGLGLCAIDGAATRGHAGVVRILAAAGADVMATRATWESRVRLDRQALRDLAWWQRIATADVSRAIWRPATDRTLHTDASRLAWGLGSEGWRLAGRSAIRAQRNAENPLRCEGMGHDIDIGVAIEPRPDIYSAVPCRSLCHCKYSPSVGYGSPQTCARELKRSVCVSSAYVCAYRVPKACWRQQLYFCTL